MKIQCDIPGCNRHGPGAIGFVNLSAKGTHERRLHGVISKSVAAKRPSGGQHACQYPECVRLQPYVTRSGLASHLRTRHAAPLSENRESVNRRERRARVSNPPPRRPRRPKLPPPPVAEGIVRYVPPPEARTPLNPRQFAYLRQRLLHCVNTDWARQIGCSPSALRDEIALLCRTNFAELTKSEARRRARA